MCAFRFDTATDARATPLQGQLFMFGPGLVAFESGDPACPRKLVYLGGLTDGLLACSYVPALGVAAARAGWSLVQPVLSSAGPGYGTSSLDQDVQELDALFTFLQGRCRTAEFALAGHSTGCQVSCHYLQKGRAQLRRMVRHVFLQAPVSDREIADPVEAKDHANSVQVAQGMSNKQDLMPRLATHVPITAERFLSLYARGGSDDYFSSDLTDEELRGRFANIAAGAEGAAPPSVLVAYSLADEYVPAFVDKRSLVDRMCAAMRGNSESTGGRVQPLLLEGANHNLSEPSDGAAIRLFLHAVESALSTSAP